jgi:imidazole glycerol-phosphate synthase subunit HisF
MKKKRLISVLLLRNGWLVQSKQFRRHQRLGNPSSIVKRLSQWAADEVVYLDISRDDSYEMQRDDLGHPSRQNIVEILEDVSRTAFMPITVGGRIRSMHDIETRLASGADKVCLNSKAIDEPQFIETASKEFGSQCIVISIDVKTSAGCNQVVTEGGTRLTLLAPEVWAKQVEELGAGEILLNSIDRDGMKTGYDLDLLNMVTEAVRIPVIACGGVGTWDHFAEALKETNVDAVAASNIFHYSDQSVYLARQYLFEQGLNVRPPELLEV